MGNASDKEKYSQRKSAKTAVANQAKYAECRQPQVATSTREAYAGHPEQQSRSSYVQKDFNENENDSVSTSSSSVFMFNTSTDCQSYFVEKLRDIRAQENEKVEFSISVNINNSRSDESIASRNNYPAIIWYHNGVEVSESKKYLLLTRGTRHSLIFRQISLNDEGLISCRVNHLGSIYETSANLLVEAPPEIHLSSKQQEEGVVVESGEMVKLKIYYFGKPRPSISWFKDDVLISAAGSGAGGKREVVTDADSSMLIVPDATRSDLGEYIVKAENMIGEDTVAIWVTVTDRPSKPSRPQAMLVQSSDNVDPSDGAYQVQISWGEPEDDGGIKVGQYLIEYYKVGWDVWLKGGTSRTKSTTLVGLVADSEYKFRIKAENPYGVSDPSDESNSIFVPDPTRGIAHSERSKSTTLPAGSSWSNQAQHHQDHLQPSGATVVVAPMRRKKSLTVKCSKDGATKPNSPQFSIRSIPSAIANRGADLSGKHQFGSEAQIAQPETHRKESHDMPKSRSLRSVFMDWNNDDFDLKYYQLMSKRLSPSPTQYGADSLNSGSPLGKAGIGQSEEESRPSPTLSEILAFKLDSSFDEERCPNSSNKGPLSGPVGEEYLPTLLEAFTNKPKSDEDVPSRHLLGDRSPTKTTDNRSFQSESNTDSAVSSAAGDFPGSSFQESSSVDDTDSSGFRSFQDEVRFMAAQKQSKLKKRGGATNSSGREDMVVNNEDDPNAGIGSRYFRTVQVISPANTFNPAPPKLRSNVHSRFDSGDLEVRQLVAIPSRESAFAVIHSDNYDRRMSPDDLDAYFSLQRQYYGDDKNAFQVQGDVVTSLIYQSKKEHGTNRTGKDKTAASKIGSDSGKQHSKYLNIFLILLSPVMLATNLFVFLLIVLLFCFNCFYSFERGGSKKKETS